MWETFVSKVMCLLSRQEAGIKKKGSQKSAFMGTCFLMLRCVTPLSILDRINKEELHMGLVLLCLIIL